MPSDPSPPPTPRSRLPTIEIAVFAAFALVAALVWYFGFRTAPRINVILISCDTLRADHVACYGYRSASGAKTTPHLDALAARGVRFENAYSTTSWTLPAHVALMTGLPDQLHGVRHDATALDPNRRMLAERMTDAGYQSVGFFSGPYLHRDYGFGRGFSRYEFFDDKMELAQDRPVADIHQIRKTEHESHQWRSADKLTDKALRFLESQRDADKPFFLFLHHWDIHNDYLAPESFVTRFAPDHAVMKDRLPMRDILGNELVKRDMPAADLRYVIANYDAEIAWVDDQIGRLFARLDSLGLAENTLVVVTADHGEEFFEHANFGHRYDLNRETLHVPLIVAGPGVRKGVAIDSTVRLFDVAPTILGLAGIELRDADAFEIYGESLGPFLTGSEVSGRLRELPLIAELTRIPQPTLDGAKMPVDPTFYFHHEAYSANDHKLIEIRKRPFDVQRPLDLEGKMIEKYCSQLYSMKDGSDPLERGNLAKAQPDVLRRLRDAAESLRKSFESWKQNLPTEAHPMPHVASAAIAASVKQAGYGAGQKSQAPDEPEKDCDEGN